MASPIVTDYIRKRAEQLAPMIPMCHRGRSKVNGQGFYIIPSSTKPKTVAHYASDLGCTCSSFRNRGVCAHQQACVIVLQRQTSERIAQAQALRAQNGKCKQAGCLRTATSKVGRCADHFQNLLDELGW